MDRIRTTSPLVFLPVLVMAATSGMSATGDGRDPSELIGLWRGTSVCTDRVAAPACNDETVVYEFTRGTRAGTVRWAADKVVNGKRESMGDPFELAYDTAETCWKVEFSAPRSRVVWRLVVKGTQLAGTAHLLPGNQQVRKADLRKE